MADPSLFDVLRLPQSALIALDNRTLHFAMQPVHYIVRSIHIVSMAAFFGGIGLLDLRLMGWRGTLSLREFARHALPWLYLTFGVAMLSGAALFAYDPLRVGSHAYFMPKMVLILAGLGNALLFHRTAYLRALASEAATPSTARLAGALSLALWTGVLVFASLNVEPMPKVFLR